MNQGKGIFKQELHFNHKSLVEKTIKIINSAFNQVGNEGAKTIIAN